MSFLSKAGLACSLLGFALTASAYEARIDRLIPQGVQRGSEVKVELAGVRLGLEPEEILFYEPGVELVGVESIDKNKAAATLRVAEDCPLGRHALRLRTKTGLSNLVTLHVGSLGSLDEAEPNNTLEAAQAVPLDRTIHGVVNREDEDLYVVEIAEGERLSVEVEGLRLGRTFFDPMLEVLDASGGLIASNDDRAAAHSDAFLSLLAPAGGKVYVRVRETAYRGDGRSNYLLHLGRFPRPAAVYPPVAVRGEPTELRWIGDATGDLATTVTPPLDGPDVFDAWCEDDRGVAPSSLPIRLIDTPATLEVEPNNQQSEATPMPAPGVAAGVVQEPGDYDHFRITAKKGQTYELRVVARRLRSSLDPVLRVYDAKGKRLAGNDDDQAFPDSYVRFKAPADGDYVLQVEDNLHRGDAEKVYALTVEPIQPLVDLKMEERRRYEATRLEVPRGGRAAALMTVTRRSVGGELRIDFQGLPPGVTVEAPPLAGDYNRVPVLLSSTAEAPRAAALVTLAASRTDSESPEPQTTRFRQQTWHSRGRNNRPVWSHFAERAPVAVTEKLPFSIDLQAPKAPICRNGSLDLKVTAQRDEGFDRPISVKLLYHSPGVSSNRSRSIAKDKLEATIPVTANAKARPGDWPIVVVGETNLDGRVYTATRFVTLTVAEPYFDVSVPTLTAKQGDAAELGVKLSPRTPFEGAAKLELVGLPPGVSAEPVEVETDAESARFALTIAEDAKPGRHRGVGCRVRLTVDGEPVTYRQSYAELRIDPRRKDRTAARDAAKGGVKK